MKKFKGRVIAGGKLTGEAVVSRQGVNTLATFQKSALKNAKQAIREIEKCNSIIFDYFSIFKKL